MDRITKRWLPWVALVGLVMTLPLHAAGVASDEAPRISAAEAKAAVDKGEAVLVDVRVKVVYDTGHAEGAVSIPLSELSKRLGELPKEKLIVTYCTCHAESSSAAAVLQLNKGGFAKAAALVGGLDAWREAGGKLGASPKP